MGKKVIDNNGKIYNSVLEAAKTLRIGKGHIFCQFRDKGFYYNTRKNITLKFYKDKEQPKAEKVVTKTEADKDEQYQNYLKANNKDFDFYKFDGECLHSGDKYVVALFSDAHIEETVKPESVLNKNEYNIDIAEYRIERYFIGLSACLIKDKVKILYFASLGDTISGFIHESLQQENGMTPPEAERKAQSLIVSGLKYLKTHNPSVKIIFIGICGNHSRLTKKIQYDNGYKLSYEYIMYHNIEDICELSNIDVEFNIPNSEMALVETPDKRKFIFIHGYQIRGSGTGTVCGIYPALQRLAMKWDRVFHQDKIFLGHFHSVVSIPTATVNGSIIGYNAFAMSNAMSYEEPAQVYELYDMNIGHLLTRKIYCK